MYVLAREYPEVAEQLRCLKGVVHSLNFSTSSSLSDNIQDKLRLAEGYLQKSNDLFDAVMDKVTKRILKRNPLSIQIDPIDAHVLTPFLTSQSGQKCVSYGEGESSTILTCTIGCDDRSSSECQFIAADVHGSRWSQTLWDYLPGPIVMDVSTWYLDSFKDFRRSLAIDHAILRDSSLISEKLRLGLTQCWLHRSRLPSALSQVAAMVNNHIDCSDVYLSKTCLAATLILLHEAGIPISDYFLHSFFKDYLGNVRSIVLERDVLFVLEKLDLAITTEGVIPAETFKEVRTRPKIGRALFECVYEPWLRRSPATGDRNFEQSYKAAVKEIHALGWLEVRRRALSYLEKTDVLKGDPSEIAEWEMPFWRKWF